MTLAAIGFGVAGLILSGGFVEDIFVQLGDAIIQSQAGHVQIAKKGFSVEGSRSPEKYLIPDPKSERTLLSTLPEVGRVTARISFSGLLNNGRSSMPAIGEGIEAEKEQPIGSYMRLMAGRMLSDRNPYELLIGEGLARALRLQPGDRVNVVVSTGAGAMNTLDFEIAGIFQSFSKDYDARVVKIPLSAAQELLDTKGANALVILLKDRQLAEPIAAKLRGYAEQNGLEVKSWRELNDFYDKTKELYREQFGVFRMIILAMVFLGVRNAVSITVAERASEFGTMRALGTRRRQVFRTILVESLLLGLLGAVLGIVVGVLAAFAVSKIGIPMPPPPNSNIGYTARIQLIPSLISGSFAIGMLATLLASVLPALRASRMPIADALRQAV